MTEGFSANTLQQIKEQFEKNYDSLPIGVVLVDSEGRVVANNTVALEILGVHENLLTGREVGSFPFEVIHLDGSSVEKNQTPSARALSTGETQRNIIVGIRSSERTVWLNANAQPLFNEESLKPFAALSSFVDITNNINLSERLQRSEERFDHATRAGKTGVWDWNLKTGEFYLHPSLKKAFGYDDNEIENKLDSILEHIHSDDRDTFANALKDAVEKQLENVQTEFRAFHRDGTERFLVGQGTIAKDQQGTPVRLVGTVTDLTELRRTQDALKRSQKMDALGKMASGIAHDFNNILGVILGNLNLIVRQHPGDEKTVERLANIEKSVNRAVDLTRKLLGFARKSPYEVSTVDINDQVEEAISLIRRSITPKIELQYDLAENLWQATLDRGELQDALLNLSLNARDAMPNGGSLKIQTSNETVKESEISRRKSIPPGDYVHIAIEDTGDGIPPGVIDHIFEPFFTTKQKDQGTGLGLAMVYGFVKRFGGHIAVNSQEGVGTTFDLCFPRVTQDTSRSPQEKLESQSLPKGHETILVVDDEAELLELIKESLCSLGYNVLTANNGHAAIEQLESEKSIALLISDVIMPGGISGFDLVDQIIVRNLQPKILLMSGYAGQALDKEHKTLSKFKLLNKPFNDSQLSQAVRSVLDQSAEDSIANAATVENRSREPRLDLAWSESLSVGVDLLDKDHQEIFRLLKLSREMLSNKEPVSMMSSLLVELEDHLSSHFGREEEVMRACGYPGFKEHSRTHGRLIQRLHQMRTELDQNRLDSHSIFSFLEKYLLDHLQRMDLDFKPYCEGKSEQIDAVL